MPKAGYKAKGRRGGSCKIKSERLSGSMGELAEVYLEYLAVRNYSEGTLTSRREHLRVFFDW